MKNLKQRFKIVGYTLIAVFIFPFYLGDYFLDLLNYLFAI